MLSRLVAVLRLGFSKRRARTQKSPPPPQHPEFDEAWLAQLGPYAEGSLTPQRAARVVAEYQRRQRLGLPLPTLSEHEAI